MPSLPGSEDQSAHLGESFGCDVTDLPTAVLGEHVGDGLAFGSGDDQADQLAICAEGDRCGVIGDQGVDAAVHEGGLEDGSGALEVQRVGEVDGGWRRERCQAALSRGVDAVQAARDQCPCDGLLVAVQIDLGAEVIVRHAAIPIGSRWRAWRVDHPGHDSGYGTARMQRGENIVACEADMGGG